MSQLQLRYVILYVPNTLKAVAFYEKAFGLERRFVHPSETYAEMETGHTALTFANEDDVSTRDAFVRNRASEKAAGVEIALVTEEIEAAFERAVAAGAMPLMPPAEKPWGQTIAYVRDLNGFLVELCTPIKQGA